MGQRQDVSSITHTLLTVIEPITEPMVVNAIPSEFIQETVMLNAVKSLRSDNGCQGCYLSLFNAFREVHHSVERGRLHGMPRSKAVLLFTE